MAKYSKTHLSGIRLMIQASFAFSLMALCVKWAAVTLPSLEIVFFRSFIGTAMVAALAALKKISLIGKKFRGLMFWRGVSGFAALSLFFYTVGHLPLGTAVILNYTSPLFAAVFAALFLKERVTFFLFSMLLTAFLGIYLLFEGGAGQWTPAMVTGLLSAVFAAIAYILIRAIGHRESPLTVIFYFTAISTLGSLFYLPFGYKWPSTQGWLALAGVGIGSFYGQLWMTIALRRAPASLVSPFSYLTPLFTFLYGLIFFGETLTAVAILGVMLIIGAGCLISYFETRPSKKTL